MNKYFNEYIEMIERHRALLLYKLHHESMNDKKVLATEKEDLEFTKARFTSAIAFTKQLLSSGDMADIAHLSKQASEQLESLTKLKKPHNIDERAWCFVPKEQPAESFVMLLSPLSFLNPPKYVSHGSNVIVISAFARPTVNITTNHGIPCQVNEIATTGHSLSWRVNYVIPAHLPVDNIHITAQVLGSTVSTRIPCYNTQPVQAQRRGRRRR